MSDPISRPSSVLLCHLSLIACTSVELDSAESLCWASLPVSLHRRPLLPLGSVRWTGSATSHDGFDSRLGQPTASADVLYVAKLLQLLPVVLAQRMV